LSFGSDSSAVVLEALHAEEPLPVQEMLSMLAKGDGDGRSEIVRLMGKI
jgi:hypothetical protein